MLSPRPFLVLTVAWLTGCQPTSETSTRAQALVARFEQAVRDGDRAGVRDAVTFDSRAAVDAMELVPTPSKAPLVVLDAVARGSALQVRVRDPNQHDQPGVFVVVAENGDLRIDLIASAGLTAREVPQPGAATRTVMRPLSPAEIERAGHMARQGAKRAAAPPR